MISSIVRSFLPCVVPWLLSRLAITFCGNNDRRGRRSRPTRFGDCLGRAIFGILYCRRFGPPLALRPVMPLFPDLRRLCGLPQSEGPWSQHHRAFVVRFQRTGEGTAATA